MNGSRTVSLYVAQGCHLCDIAREALETLRKEVPFEIVETDITGDVELERTYREWLPVVEIERERISVYRVDEELVRHKLALM